MRNSISFTAYCGGILGLAEMMGAGRTELIEGILELRTSTAAIRLSGKPITVRSPREAIDAGSAYMMAQRKETAAAGATQSEFDAVIAEAILLGLVAKYGPRG
jgi:ABC-type sugar transport system ATPase subunit